MTEASPKRPPTPRWVKIAAAVAGAALLALVVLLLAKGGHGPSRHTGSAPPVAAVAP